MSKRFFFAVVMSVALLAACGGGGGSSNNVSGASSESSLASSTPGATSNVANQSATSNVANQIQVQVGPSQYGDRNMLMASVTICVPGTTTCTTIDNVQVDTGSYGLRLFSSAIGGLPLPRTTAQAGGTLATCAAFGSGTAWGAVATADVKLAGEVASAVPIQIIGDSAVGTSPTSCTNQGIGDLNTPTLLGANGLLGVGLESQDCGDGCAANAYVHPVYYGCTSATNCVSSKAAIAQQVTNPVSLFATDNNGVSIQLPAVPATGQSSVTGTLTFGIGTQSNNVLGAATVYTTSAASADQPLSVNTQYKGTTYHSFFDSGSNGIFFDDSTIAQCVDGSGFFCPASTLSLSATMSGTNNASVTLDFSVANAQSMVDNYEYAMNSFDGYNVGVFDWGLGFFYGRTVFTAIDGRSTPGGSGPYFAF